MARPTWDEFYLGMAHAGAARAECTRRQVGAVIVRSHTVMATGYNGAPPGLPNCLDGHCPRATSTATPGEDYAASGCVAIHAEANAIIRAGRDRCLGATIYLTTEPCELCRPLILAAGIERVVYGTPEDYRSEASAEIARSASRGYRGAGDKNLDGTSGEAGERRQAVGGNHPLERDRHNLRAVWYAESGSEGTEQDCGT